MNAKVNIYISLIYVILVYLTRGNRYPYHYVTASVERFSSAAALEFLVETTVKGGEEELCRRKKNNRLHPVYPVEVHNLHLPEEIMPRVDDVIFHLRPSPMF